MGPVTFTPMTERDQWRFQWPDGTWIRWNAQTQSWEKEEPGSSPSSEPSEDPDDATDPESVEDVPRPAPDFSARDIREPAARQEPTASERAGWSAPTQRSAEELRSEEEDEEEAAPPAEHERAPIEEAPATGRRHRRPMVDDVLPSRAEPDRPGGSLWPTVIVAVIVGLGVGLLLWSIIR